MTEPPFKELLPFTAAVNYKNRLSIGGCDLVELTEDFGTPLYVYDEYTIRRMCRIFREAFETQYPDVRVAYSSKAFANPAVARILMEEGLGMDIVTGGELAVAMAAEFPPEIMNFHGNSKSPKEIKLALDYGLGKITVDSFEELTRLEEIARKMGVIQNILIRVSPGIDPCTHRLTATGALDSKFGFPIETGDAEEAVKRAMGMPSLNLVGVHFHLGSPIFELEPYPEAIGYVLDFVGEMRDRYGFKLREFSPGGGFAIGYISDQQPPEISEYAEVIAEAIDAGCARNKLEMPNLVVEPGRAIIGRAGIALYSVLGRKDVPGVRRYIHVDGGMGDNIRPALYGAKYTVVSADMPLAEHSLTASVAGKFCESGDVLVWDAQVPAESRLLALTSAGAYCLSMSSNYLMEPRPAAVMVSKGESRVIRRRETYEDVMASSMG